MDSDPSSSTEKVLLEGIDGQQRLVSKRLLAADSGYFRSLFYGNYTDTTSPIQKLPFSGQLLDEILAGIEKAHLKEMPIWSLSKSCDLLTSAAYLQIDCLMPLLQQTILEKINVGNMLKIIRFAELRDFNLAERLWRLLLKYFNKIVEAEEYLHMTDCELYAALSSERLNIDSRLESKVIANYIATVPDSREVQQLARNMSITGDGKASHPVVMNRVPREVLICLGGWSINGPTEIVEIFNPRNEQWRRGGPVIEGERRAYHTLNWSDKHIYICGGMNGREFFRDVSCYDLDTREWKHLCNLIERRCYAMGVTMRFSDGTTQLMILGGFNGNVRLSSCEVIAMNSQGNYYARHMKPMSKMRSDASAIVMEDGIFAVGGFDGRTIHQDAECFDPATDSWMTVGKRMSSPRTGVSAIPLNRNVCIVAGGFNGTARLSTAELYDTREGKWHVLPRMNTTRSNFALELINGEVYAIGGFDGVATTNLCERYNVTAQQWQEIPPISIPRSALKAFRLTDHDIIRELVGFKSLEYDGRERQIVAESHQKLIKHAN